VAERPRNERAGFVAAGMLAPHAEGLEGAMLALGQTRLACAPVVGQRESRQRLALPALLRQGSWRAFSPPAASEAGLPHRFAGAPLDSRRTGKPEMPGHRRRTFVRAAVRPGRPRSTNRRQFDGAWERLGVERGRGLAKAHRGCWN